MPKGDERARDLQWIIVRLPFALIAGFAQITAVLWGAVADPTDFWASTGLLLCALSVSVLTRYRRPLIAVTGCLYLASASLLVVATAGTTSGMFVLLLMPVVGAALYGRKWELVVVVCGVVGASLGVSLATESLLASTVRRVVLYGFLASMISVSIYGLRTRLEASNRRKGALLHQAEMINAAAKQLTSLLDPSAITAAGAELAARLASPPGSMRRGNYFRVEREMASVESQYDELGLRVQEEWPLVEHPFLERVVRTREPLMASLLPADLGPTLRRIVAGAGVTHGAWVPVLADGELHGVLAVAGRGSPITQDCFDQLVALGHLLELALSNCKAHERLEKQATIEERRRIARELHDGLAHELAFIASRTGASHGALQAHEVRELSNAADRALDEARRAITVLSVGEPEPLHLCIARTVEDLGARFALPVHLDLDEEVALGPDSMENVLRILREAITNAGRHAHANELAVRLRGEPEVVRMSIHDDGRGFDPLKVTSAGFGLISMRERSEMIGGQFCLRSRPGHGTCVEVAVPRPD